MAELWYTISEPNPASPPLCLLGAFPVFSFERRQPIGIRKHENHPKTHKTGGAKQFFEKKTVSETT
ncbi:MAG: hypothetical protein IK954_03300, partial [Clostridia bacterium]|nr:hypothetical protein [Clostridia bacterium]